MWNGNGENGMKGLRKTETVLEASSCLVVMNVRGECVCMCACVYVCVRMCVCVCVCVCLWGCACMCVCVCVCLWGWGAEKRKKYCLTVLVHIIIKVVVVSTWDVKNGLNQITLSVWSLYILVLRANFWAFRFDNTANFCLNVLTLCVCVWMFVQIHQSFFAYWLSD